MERSPSLQLLADILQSVLEGEIGAMNGADITARLPNDIHPDVHDVMAHVEHFLADADIRADDLHYRSMQEDQMKGLINALRNNADSDKLLRFTFI